LPRLMNAAGHLLECEIVGLPAQIFGQLAFRERAEEAAERTDVGVVDVAIDHVAHDIADRLLAKRVGRGADGIEIRTACLEQANDLLFLERDAGRCLIEDVLDRSAGAAMAWFKLWQ